MSDTNTFMRDTEYPHSLSPLPNNTEVVFADRTQSFSVQMNDEGLTIRNLTGLLVKMEASNVITVMKSDA